jgi:hypothetical protein
MKKKRKKPARPRIDVNVEELDQIVDRARQAPLSESDCDKLKTALHALIDRLLPPAKTEARFCIRGREPSRTATSAAASGPTGGTRAQWRAGV